MVPALRIVTVPSDAMVAMAVLLDVYTSAPRIEFDIVTVEAKVSSP